MWQKQWKIKIGMTKKEMKRAEELLDYLMSNFYPSYQSIGTVYRTNSGIERCYSQPFQYRSKVIGICVEKKPTKANQNYCKFTCDYKEAVKRNPDFINLKTYLKLVQNTYNSEEYI